MKLASRQNSPAWLIACALMSSVYTPAQAAPEEIVVFTDEMPEQGKIDVEVHANSARPRRGLANSPKRFQLMPEVAYGITDQWSLSLHAPMSFTSSGWSAHGARLKLQYIAPHSEQAGPYWGFNVEGARNTRPQEPRSNQAAAMAIMGWRHDSMHLAVNAAMVRRIEPDQRFTDFEYAAKFANSLANQSSVGLEYYGSRPVNTGLAGGAPYRSVFAVWDVQLGSAELHLGIGRGLTPESDRLIAKAVIGFSL